MYIVIFHNNTRQIPCIVVFHKDTSEQIPALFLIGIVFYQVCLIRLPVGHFQVLDCDVTGIVNVDCCHILLRCVLIGLPRITAAVDDRICTLAVSVHIYGVLRSSCRLLQFKLLTVPCAACF